MRRIFSKKIAASIKKLVILTKKIAEDDMTYRIDLPSNDESNEVAQAIYQMCDGRFTQRDRLRQNFARYVSTNLFR